MPPQETTPGACDRASRPSTLKTAGTLLTTAAILLATALVWSGALGVPFHYDDLHTVEHNLEIRDLSNVPEFLAHFFQRGALKIGFALNYALCHKQADGSPAPGGFHGVNLALHCANAVLAFGLTMLILDGLPDERVRPNRLPIAAAVALVFALHPIHAMAVCLVASRAVLQAATFSLLSLILLLFATNGDATRPARVWLSVAATASFACGLGSKSVAVAVPALAALTVWTLQPAFLAAGRRTRRVLLPTAFALLVIGIVAAFLYVGRGIWQEDYHGPWTNLLTQAGVVTRYVGLLFWPDRLSIEHEVSLATSLWSVRAALPAAFVGVLLAAGAVLTYRRRLLGLCICWFLVALTPSSSLVPRLEQMVEYRTYLSVLGFAGVAVWLVCGVSVTLSHRLKDGRGGTSVMAVALGALLLGALAISTINRIGIYADPITLWADAVEIAPHRPRPAFNLGVSLASAGRPADALPHLLRAAEMQPARADVHLALGRVYAALNQPQEAIVRLQQAERLADQLPLSYAGVDVDFRTGVARELWRLGNRLAAQGRLELAAQAYRDAVRGDPPFGDAHYNLGEVLLSLRRFDQAVQAWRSGLEQAPNDLEMAAQLAWQLAACPDAGVRDGADAVRLAERVVARSDPAPASLLDLLAAAHAEAGDFSAAVRFAKHSLELAEQQGLTEQAQATRRRLELYEIGHPYRESPGAPETTR